jgi:hypothetical protein
MILYPQLPRAVAEHLTEQRRKLTIAEAADKWSWDHPDAFFTATGGSPATKDGLIKLRERILGIAKHFGYPSPGREQEFDKPAAASLHSLMKLSPAEAAKSGVWEFVSCVLLCDIVRWRFPGDAAGSPPERFLASRRNTFQRLWWRGFVLHDDDATDAYHLLYALGEDEAVQIMERPFLAGSRALSRTVARELLSAAQRHPNISRRTLIREAQKRMRRLAAFTSFEAIEEELLTPFVRSIFEQVVATRTELVSR